MDVRLYVSCESYYLKGWKNEGVSKKQTIALLRI